MVLAMDQRKNPYTPGAGLRPAALTGRDEELRSWAIALERVENARVDRSVVLHGLHGVGKSVLLRELRRLVLCR